MLKPNLMDLPLFEQWLKDKHTLAESSIYTYTKSIENFLIIRNLDLNNIDCYNEYIVDKAIKKRSRHYQSAVKEFIKFKFNNDKQKRNSLLELIINPKERFDYKRERIYLPENKIIEVINYIETFKHRTIALIQTLTGVRVGDVLRLKKGSIMSEEYQGNPVLKIIVVGKGMKRNVIFIHDEIAQDLIMSYITTHNGWDDYYFIELGNMKNRKGNINSHYMMGQMNYKWYWNDLKQALHTAGVDKKLFATHDMRRCFARRVWDKYKDIHALQSLLGHRDPKTTLRYLEQSGLKNVDYHYEMQK